MQVQLHRTLFLAHHLPGACCFPVTFHFPLAMAPPLLSAGPPPCSPPPRFCFFELFPSPLYSVPLFRFLLSAFIRLMGRFDLVGSVTNPRRPAQLGPPIMIGGS